VGGVEAAEPYAVKAFRNRWPALMPGPALDFTEPRSWPALARPGGVQPQRLVRMHARHHNLPQLPSGSSLSSPHVQSADTSRNLGQIVVELVIPAGQPMNDRAGYRSRIEIEMRKWSRVVIAAVVEVDRRI
jgi:hypothetical protein